MKRWLSRALLLGMMALTPCAGAAAETMLTPADAQQTFEQGKKLAQDGVKVVSLHGTWRKMGRQYGALMKDELHEVYDFVQRISESIGNAEAVDAVVQTQKKQTPYRIRSFFEGAAETSGLTVEQLHHVNAVEYIGGMPQCSAAICWGGYAADKLVAGRNYDYSTEFLQLKDDVVVTVYHPSDGALAAATIGYAGEIYAVNGLNEKGIFLELNNGTPSSGLDATGRRISGTTMLFEALFEADALDSLELFFNTVGCDLAYIINVADENRGRSYEWCTEGVKRGEQTLPEGLLVSSNYFVNPDWTFETPSDAACWSGLTRRANLIELCEANKGRVDAAAMREIIGTTLENGGAMNGMTVYQMVVEPKTRALWLRVIGASAWVGIDLNGFLTEE